MPLYKWLRTYLEKYSFVTKVELVNSSVKIYYNKNGQETFKRISYRANKDMLIECIESIKKDINYYENKLKKIEDEEIDFSIAFTN